MTQPLPPDLAQALERLAPRLTPLAREVYWYAETASTNDVAGVFAERGAAEGLLVIADAQTAGRGRSGRTWSSPPGAGLYVSVLLRPARTVPLITLASGVAVAEGVRAASGFDVELKWPNDVLAGGRKLAGILCEAGDGLRHVIVGIGINVRAAAHPADVAGRATSLEEELGRPVDRGLVLAECLAALAARYRDLEEGRADAVLAAWRRHGASGLTRRVEWDADGVRYTGVAEDVAGDGALVVRTTAGVRRVMAGEVRWIA